MTCSKQIVIVPIGAQKKRTTINARNIYRGTSYQPTLEANMQNNNSTLSGYNSLLTSHIKDVAKFNRSTKDWLSDSTAADLFFEDAANRIVREELGLLQDKLSTRQKILTIIKEIANHSKSYLDRLVGISAVFEGLIRLVDKE